MKKILVTGGAGFLGSHLCERLLNEGNQVICLDNFYTGRIENISNLRNNPNFTLVRGDVENPISEYVNEIYNLACPASPPHYQKHPTRTIRTSVLGAMNLLELANRCGAKILQASTSEVYGNPLEHPQRESYVGNVNPIGIRACYDEGKRCAEALFFDYNREFNTRTKVIRIFNTYGPNMDPDDGRVVSNFIIQAIKQEDITVYGDGQQTRSFCYVSDLIDGMIKLMNTGDSVTGPVNVGNPSEITVLEIARTIIGMTGSKSKIIFKELPADDPIKRKPDIQKAQELLQWTPVVGLTDGLTLTIEYFKRLLEG